MASSDSQSALMSPEASAQPRIGKGLCLLCLDGGGIRGLSSLMILSQIMENINHEDPPKPCDYFDLIGGTSTGGILAIMLGRLRMSVDECIDAYTRLSSTVFVKIKHRISIRGNIQGRFDGNALEKVVTDELRKCGLSENTLLKEPAESDGCKV